MALRAGQSLDGRQSRSARSRLAICEACLDLLQEGVLQPSADQIAERAKLSRRSIFYHFSDLAELYDAVVEVGMERCAPLLREIPIDLPVAERVEQLTDVRARFFEATAPFTRAMTAQVLVGPACDQARRVSRNALRLQKADVQQLLGAELGELSQAEQGDALEALSAVVSPAMWEFLRRSQGLSVARARAVLRRTVTAILRDAGFEVD